MRGDEFKNSRNEQAKEDGEIYIPSRALLAMSSNLRLKLIFDKSAHHVPIISTIFFENSIFFLRKSGVEDLPKFFKKNGC